VTKIIRELDDLRHAAEVLAQDDALTEPDFRVGIEAALRRQRMMMRNAVEIMVLQIGNSLIGDADTVRANLLIIPDHHHFLRDVEEEKALDAELAGFVDDDQIVPSWHGVDHFGDQVPGHDPDRYRVAALIHVLPCFAA
jgi:hypothetical protein